MPIGQRHKSLMLRLTLLSRCVPGTNDDNTVSDGCTHACPIPSDTALIRLLELQATVEAQVRLAVEVQLPQHCLAQQLLVEAEHLLLMPVA